MGETCLVFDDRSVIHLSPALPASLEVPTERSIIKALRDAILEPRSVAGIHIKPAASPPPPSPAAPAADSDSQQLRAAEKAFAAVLTKRCSVSVVCLLHEDFPDELPVFGHELAGMGMVGKGRADGEEGAAAGAWNGSHGVGSGGRRPGGEALGMHVMMVLGTVRDMTEAERRAPRHHQLPW